MLFVEMTLLLEPLADSPLAVFRVSLGSVHRRVVVTSVETVAQTGDSMVQFTMVLDCANDRLLSSYGLVLACPSFCNDRCFIPDSAENCLEVLQLQFIFLRVWASSGQGCRRALCCAVR